MIDKVIIRNIFKLSGTKFTLFITFIFITLFLLVSTRYIIPSFEEQIMLNTVDEAQRVSTHLISVYKKNKSFIHMERMKNDLKIQKIKFFDPSGRILYSTSKKDIGTINKKDYYHNIVAKGKVFYKIVKKGKNTLEKEIIQTDVAEIYIPILENNKFQYAFEMYYDISTKVKSFDELILKIKFINYLVIVLILLSVMLRLYSLSKLNIQEKEAQEKLLLSEKMASMGEMIGNIAHQWRQPLSVITVGTTGIQIQNELGTLEKDGINKTCERINRNAQYLSKTIDDFSKYIKGDRVLSLFNLKLHIDDVLLLLEATLKNNSINVVLDIKDNIEVKGYPNELTQCLINICMNANDALLNQDIEDRNLFISSSSKKNFVEIKVRDNAGGIPQDIIKKIFDPYFTTKHQSQGTGRGLHMSYKLIVEGIEGTLNVQNVDFEYQDTKYTGAEFIICIPV